ncbi:glycine zipper 2TM domain-containing protein [Sphingobium aromaticiconvertens]|uniref:glycine zipper 2TM domain-containing protein n=1 Tax=Sphingobium aromaticiconvertens TaxID=365341 RepID=UPI00301A4CE3
MKITINKTLATLTLGAIALTAVPASAQRHDDRRDSRHERRDDKRDYRADRRDDRRDNRQGWRNDRRPGKVVYNYDYNRPDPRYRNYYAERYYRGGSGYAPVRVTRQTRIYRGSNDHYYCRRSDGTTGLIVGAALGGVLGNQLDRGGSNLLGTLIGGGAGALLGREIDRGGVSCR